MNSSPAFSWSATVAALVRMAIAYGIIFNPYTKFPFTFVAVIAAVVVMCLLQARTLSVIGFRSNLSLKKIGLWTLGAFLAIEGLMDFILQPLIDKLMNEPVDYSYFSKLTGNTSLYLKYLAYTWISAAIGEEVLFRGFLFYQLKNIIPATKWRNGIIAVLSSILFSIPHYYMGWSGLIVTFIMGLLFSILYIRSGYNLWVCILVHGAIDTLFLTLAYWGKLDYYEWANKIF